MPVDCLITPRRGGLALLALLVFVEAPSAESLPLPPPAEMAVSLVDLWGEASLAAPGGPSYAFFKDLLPPLQYANTAFRHYPIVLCAPAAGVKVRWVSNGSGVNLRADKKPMWKEGGVPVSFRVGDPSEPFGADLSRIDGPRYDSGALPIVRVAYSKDGATYRQEAFAPVGDPWVTHGGVLLRFTASNAPGVVVAQFDRDEADTEAQAVVLHDRQWTWDADKKQFRARLSAGGSAVLAVLTKSLPPPWPILETAVYERERLACREHWDAFLGRGAALAIPERVVQDAWRALVAGNFLIADGDQMNYSAGNAYDHLYEAECGDALRSLMLYGFQGEARRMVKPLLDFNRQATRFHVAGHKLQLLAHYYWVTGDAASLRDWEPAWSPVIEFLLQSIQPEHGLLPPDRYAGDIAQEVHALSSNSNAWRGLRDMAAVIAELGDAERAEQLRRASDSFRAAILRAVAASEKHDVVPPFIPNALFGLEKAYPALTATRLGSYYDLMAPYIIGSGVFGPGDRRTGWMIEYLRSHGGIALG